MLLLKIQGVDFVPVFAWSCMGLNGARTSIPVDGSCEMFCNFSDIVDEGMSSWEKEVDTSVDFSVFVVWFC